MSSRSLYFYVLGVVKVFGCSEHHQETSEAEEAFYSARSCTTEAGAKRLPHSFAPGAGCCLRTQAMLVSVTDTGLSFPGGQDTNPDLNRDALYCSFNLLSISPDRAF